MHREVLVRFCVGPYPWGYDLGRRSALLPGLEVVPTIDLAKQTASCIYSLMVLLGVEFNWTVSTSPYNVLFGFDYLNRSTELNTIVPWYSLVSEVHIGNSWQGTDHARTNKISQVSRNRESASSLFIRRNMNSRSSSRRCYSWQVGVNNNDSEWDTVAIKYSGQNARHTKENNLGNSSCDLIIMKKEIISEMKQLTPLLAEDIDTKNWPMLKWNKEIRTLVSKKQKYLCLLSREYGLRSNQVEFQINNWLSSLVMRIFAVETVYKSKWSNTPGVDSVILKQENLLEYVNRLKFDSLLQYKSSPIRRVFISKIGSKKERPLGIPTIYDRIVQTLFVQILDPVMEPWSDIYSFGYRKGRNAHQAIGELSKILYITPLNKRSNRGNKRYFNHQKYILSIDIKGFFDNVNHDYLLNNYPFPRKFKHILEEWLKSPIIYQDAISSNTTGFPQGSVIGPSLANFTLNGLEEVIKPSQKTKVDTDKQKYILKTTKIKYTSKDSIIRKTISNRIVRYADDFIVISNDFEEIHLLNTKIKEFLKQRGLNINEDKSKLYKWSNNVKFNYLGFTFHYITKTKRSRITEQMSNKGTKLRGGLYVYPCDFKIKTFKMKIKSILRNINMSPYRIIQELNPIIRGWGNYFGIGTLRIFSRIDHYIWYRTWRYLTRKYKKVSRKILIQRYYQGIENPSKRLWHFHGTWEKASNDTKLRKGNVSWLLLLSKLVKGIPAHMLRAPQKMLNTPIYIDSTPYEEWSTYIFERRNSGKSSNNWSDLYKKQKGVCMVCEESLGYLLEESLEIHHVKPLSENKENKSVNDITNLWLIHKSCHKQITVTSRLNNKYNNICVNKTSSSFKNNKVYNNSKRFYPNKKPFLMNVLKSTKVSNTSRVRCNKLVNAFKGKTRYLIKLYENKHFINRKTNNTHQYNVYATITTDENSKYNIFKQSEEQYNSTIGNKLIGERKDTENLEGRNRELSLDSTNKELNESDVSKLLYNDRNEFVILDKNDCGVLIESDDSSNLVQDITEYYTQENE